ncbi:MAG TPA: ABC transporter permease [Trebonia sp.]|jgi:peptide/nickel transport system permease protein|nr:ABC transporter permease [Trebonia sp.]
MNNDTNAADGSKWWQWAAPRLRRASGRPPRLGTGTWVIIALLLIIVLATILAPWISPYSPTAVSSAHLVGPGAQHLFGTDDLGRDVFSRTLWGGRVSLVSAALAVLMATIAGTALGLIAGYSHWLISSLIMRIMDIVLGFPALLLALLVLATAGGGTLPEAIAISIAFVPVFTRVVYLSSLSIKQEGYVTAARVAGLRAAAIMRKHILPAVQAEVLVIMTSAFGWAILLASTLSFLGLGAQPPTPDWGADLNAGQSYLVDGWWISLAPGIAITITILLVNLLGDQLAGGTRRGAVRRGAGADTATVLTAATSGTGEL